MFNLTILEVAIGLVFIYLLLSLLCSAANEIVELLLKKRAIDLERGIRELLDPASKTGRSDSVKEFYNHPLVNSLFSGKYEKSRIGNFVARKVLRTKLPSYIPARTFALALMDLILPGVTVPLTSPPSPLGATGPMPSGTAGATPPPSDFKVTLAAPPPPPPSVLNPDNPLIPLRDALGTNPLFTDHAKQALTSLIDAAGSDVAKARENIEGWFNSSMDRVSSWYKRRTQVVILIIGLLVTIGINADTVTIVRTLSTDKALRESLVSAATEYAKAHAEAKSSESPTPTNTQPSAQSQSSPPGGASGSGASSTPSPSPNTSASPVSSPSPSPSPTPSPSPQPECVSDPTSSACRYAKLLQTIPQCLKDKNSLECRQEARLQMIPACEKPDSRDTPACKYELNKAELESLGLPIGWSSVDDPHRKWPGSNLGGDGGWLDQLWWHSLGWLLTALAVSLGAPFWFDLLNKFIVIRSAVKPHEKSLEEESKG